MNALIEPQRHEGREATGSVVTKVVEVPEVCCLPWARIVLRNGMILSVNDEGVNVWRNEAAEREGIVCDGLTFGFPLAGNPISTREDLNSVALSQAQAEAVMGELVLKSELGDVAELLELIVAGKDTLVRAAAKLESIVGATYHPVIGTMLHFIRLGAGHARGAEMALRAARRLARQINHEGTKGDGQ